MLKKQFKNEIIVLSISVAILLIVGAFTFVWLEKWSFVNAFYFVAMTATTVGYGDFTPTHTLSKIITIIYSLSIIPFVVYAFSAVARYHAGRIYKTVKTVEHKQNVQEEEIEKNERKLAENKKRLREQAEELKKQERMLKKEIKLDRKFEEEIFEHGKELEGHQKKIKKQAEVEKIHEEELKEHDKELAVVEEIVESELERENKSKKKAK